MRKVLISQLISLVAVAIAAVALANEALQPSQALPGCSGKCGNLTVPYPFGIGEGCFLREKFNLTCNESTQPPTLLWADGTIMATNISVVEGEMQILSFKAYDCYDKQGYQAYNMRSSPSLQVGPPFTISGTRNRFVAVGSDTFAIFTGYRHYPDDQSRHTVGCLSISDNLDDITTTADAAGNKELCSGIGCCTTSIPNGLKNRTIELSSYYNHTYVRDFNPCSYAFIVEEGKFLFNPNTSFQQLDDTPQLPMILNWEIADGSCAQAQKRPDYACKANSECVNRTIDVNTKPTGYYCRCKQGYEGNPYLPYGCQDTDECKAPTNPCNNGMCKNTIGGYDCICKNDFLLGIENPKGCIPNPISNNKSLEVGLGVSLSFVGLLLVTFWIYHRLKGRKFNQLKAKYYKDGGGFLLEQKLQIYEGHQAAVKIFTIEELEKATRNFDDTQKIGEGGNGFVYKGTLLGNKEIAVKMSKSDAPMTQRNQFINEVLVLSQINHRNVVRLLGCCLENKTPLLVYEFVSNGTLYEHIHKKNGKGPLSFGLRMRIAAETAGCLAYLHYDASMQIVHRDVKATNILLDENFRAKVTDFGAPNLVPEDQNQLSTLVQGTLGYLDPEYLQSHTLTEKSDVYSFGVVLVELITSQVAISHQKPEAEKNLANTFLMSVEDNNLDQILDHEIIKERSFEIAQQVAHLAKRCLSLKGGDRPTMKVVENELKAILADMAQHPGGKPDSSPKEINNLLASSPSNACNADVRGDEGEVRTSIDYNQSMQNQSQMMKPYEVRRKFKQLKEKYYKDNGGVLSQEKLQTYKGHQAAVKSFTIEELNKATKNFDDAQKIGGNCGYVYKGTLPGNKEIAVKKSKSDAPMTQSSPFINEVLVLSQTNHKNVVRLLGCCGLETEMPMLVYEFVTNGTLYEHIHKKNGKGLLSFGLRMRIAAETAGSLAYLHYDAPMQIVHRDVKATNILLDENFRAKVSSFGASKLDPEYLQSNTLTEKIDVYSFGVVLVELITSQGAISHETPEAERKRNLANTFLVAVEHNNLKHILDHEIIKEGSFKIAEQVAYLAKRCLCLKEGDRPTMKDVENELKAILAVIVNSEGELVMWLLCDSLRKFVLAV